MEQDSWEKRHPVPPEGSMMLQVKLEQLLFFSLTQTALVLFCLGCASTISAQGYDDTFSMNNRLKIEFQYADYFTYEYPEPVIFRYGRQDYSQDLPFLANFPEKRGLPVHYSSCD